MENNKVIVVGTITEKYEYDHKVFGECFYRTAISLTRKSGKADVIPVMISERLIDVTEDMRGCRVALFGEYRSFNQRECERTKLILFIFCQEIRPAEDCEQEDENNVYLNGFVCKEPTYRKTPLGRDITDILVAVNRPYGKTDYIPCVAWGRNARWSGGLSVGKRVQILGRIQSREYKKALSETSIETRVAYEVSTNSISSVAG